VLVVVVDTSTPAVTAAVARVTGGAVEVLAQRRTVDARAHGELLAPSVAAMLSQARVAVGELGAVVAGLGPGPFTGLRVGLVTAAALGQALAIPTYGVCSLDGLGALTSGPVLAATDARRKEIYWAVYADGVRVQGPAVGRAAEVATHLPAGVVAVGDGARLYADALGVPVRDEPRYPDAGALAALAADRVRSAAPGETLVPLYLRRPDAVEPGAPKSVGT
jgi:tRNA threonylcarbamoyl adenosine modification protein YeaZ